MRIIEMFAMALAIGLYTLVLEHWSPEIATRPLLIPSFAHACPRVQPDKGIMLSQSAEDEHLLLFFNGLCNGTYVELGALDGLTYSNTYAFNKALGWKGVLIEPSPSNFEKLQSNRRDELAVINAAVCAEASTVHYVDAGAVGGVWEFAAPGFREHWWGADASRPIQCLPLKDVFAALQERLFVDFLSLDVEGAELEVLQSVDYAKAAFGVILVEADSFNASKNAMVRSFLAEKGYMFLYHHQRSDWFVNRYWKYVY